MLSFFPFILIHMSLQYIFHCNGLLSLSSAPVLLYSSYFNANCPSFRLLSFCRFICPSLCSSVHHFVYLPIFLSICLFFSPSALPFVHLSGFFVYLCLFPIFCKCHLSISSASSDSSLEPGFHHNQIVGPFSSTPLVGLMVSSSLTKREKKEEY